MTPRFTRVVDQATFKDFDGLFAVLSTDVLKLLQREHAAVVRKVKAMKGGGI